ncbi:MAG: hypothetical protein EOM41_08475 [Bacilli bacterium]|nr:hypothetical protein [Bacilli bacterium]
MRDGYNPKTCGLVIRTDHTDTFNDERYALVQVSDTKVYALKPQYFNRANIQDLIDTYGDINTSLMVNGIDVKGGVYSSDGIMSKNKQLGPITLGVNPITNTDPLLYALDLQGVDNMTAYNLLIPDFKWNTSKLLFSHNISGVPISSQNSATVNYDVKAALTDAFLDTTSSITLSMKGGGSISAPAYYLKDHPVVSVTFYKTTLDGSYYTAAWGDYKTNGTIAMSDSQRCMVSGAVQYFVQNGIYDAATAGSEIVKGVVNLVSLLANPKVSTSEKALTSLSSVTDFMVRYMFTEIAYENRKQTLSNVGGEITNLPFGKTSVAEDTSSIGKQVDTFMNVSYPIATPILLTYAGFSGAGYATVKMSDLEPNKPKHFDINIGFVDYNELRSWVDSHIGPVKILNISGTPRVEYDEYNGWWSYMISRGVLL